MPANGGIVYPDECLANEQPVGTGTLGRSYVVNKADHIRVIARREPHINKDVENIAGTVMIIREGYKNANALSDEPTQLPTPPDGNLAYIYINKEGKLQLEANEIYLGRSKTKSQPYIRYTVYKATIESLQAQIDFLVAHVGNLESQLITQLTALGVAAGTDINPTLVPAFTAATSAIASINGSLNAPPTLQTEKNKITNTYMEAVKSSKIYGE